MSLIQILETAWDNDLITGGADDAISDDNSITGDTLESIDDILKFVLAEEEEDNGLVVVYTGSGSDLGLGSTGSGPGMGLGANSMPPIQIFTDIQEYIKNIEDIV